MQAVHDILKYGPFDVTNYDHIEFPGAVPRTFVGALITAAIAKPILLLRNLLGSDLDPQLIVRGVIGFLNGLSLCYFRSKLQECSDDENKTSNERKHPRDSAEWFAIFLVTSFHIIYYSSRTLPNFMLAFPLTNIALAWALQGSFDWAVFLCGATAILFRLEVACLGAALALLSVVYGGADFLRVWKFGFMGIGIGLGIALHVDSHFWRFWLVPELESFFFNIVSGKSSQWGTEPAWAYVTHYLRMLFMPPTVLFLNYLGFLWAPKNLRIVTLASYAHIIGLSLQPHKEWRFIVYALPGIIAVGSVGAARIWENVQMNTIPNMLLKIIICVSPTISLLFSGVFLYVSRLNYPGGEALQIFNSYITKNNITNATVHISTLPCMTGVTRFGELDFENYGIVYDRTEEPDILRTKWDGFDYLISDEVSILPQDAPEVWEKMESVSIFTGIDLNYLMDKVLSQRINLWQYFRQVVIEQDIWTYLQEILDSTIIRQEVIHIFKRVRTEKP